MRLALPLLLLAACASNEAGRSVPAPAKEPAEFAEARALIEARESAAALELLEGWLAAHTDAPAAQRVEAHRAAGAACARLELEERGCAHLVRALELEPNDAWTHYELGFLRQRVDGPEAALASFDRALELDPLRVKAAQFRAGILWELGRLEEALAACDRTLAILAASDAARIRDWGGDPAALEAWTLELRARVLAALGRAESRAGGESGAQR